ncbi:MULTISPECIES: Rne/Rng family ribonuclease [unclassified Clostridium]|uniref:Rne/Rng family ribonuclease n=1 Tax=unclassified Clostridium TaxID=2614128 RepID=UPI00189AF8C1|nr:MULTISPECIES: Rne/Rng family ribonuclease [unclassified Clostridium]MCR1951837.1 Rne/Rng family ribonuclease [Clostridium sp. DSM 100503]
MREIFIERDEPLLRIAIRDNKILSECFVEEHSSGPKMGEIYKGRVKNIVPAINSIFVDIGLEKEAYMYFSNELKSEGIKKGDEILVEVIKEPINNKGAKVSKNISIPGRFMVLTLGGREINFSKRISNTEEKERILRAINNIDGYGITIRTEAVHASDEDLLSEKVSLLSELEAIIKKLRYSLKLGKVYGENIILNKVIRENLGNECKIILNHEEDLNEVKSLLEGNAKVSIEKFNNTRSLFDYYGIEKEILKLRHKKVALNCGGNIVIDKTEAMYVIDVNSSKNIKGRNFDKTILETNIEAASEIGRQIRLRNLGGIIVIDFIDMRDFSQKAFVMDALKEALKEDKGNMKIFPFTELDLVQIARKRRGKSIYEYLEEGCKRCNKEGYVLKLSYIEKLIRNEIIKGEEENSINSFYIELDSNYEEMVKGDIFSFLSNINSLNKEIYLNFMDGIEGYKIEPLIFNSQKENIKNLRISGYEKYE